MTTAQPAKSSNSSFGCMGWLVILAVIIGIIFFVGDASEKSHYETKETTSSSSFGDSRQTHTHSWAPATYSRPEYCISCGMERGDVKGYVGTLYGEWEDMTIEGSNCSMINLEKPIRGMRKMTFNLTVEMKAGARCKNWKCYIWNGERWINKGILTIPEGNGSGTQTFYGDGTETIGWIAVVPTAQGSYSYTQYLYLTDVQQN